MHLLPNAGINYHAHYAPKQSVGMAVCSLSSLLLLTLSASVFISAFMAARADDQAALLALKVAAISGRYDDPIPSWNGSTGGYCSWEGVRCRGRVALSLPYRRFTGVLSPSIGNLSSLRILNFSFNAFSEAIPATLGRLRHLRVLDLSRNTHLLRRVPSKPDLLHQPKDHIPPLQSAPWRRALRDRQQTDGP
jgi:Leucine-rich repeat (LRR) protein